MVANASEESETDSSISTPLRQPQPAGATAAAAAALSQLEFLQSKLQDLEEENLVLRSEVSVMIVDHKEDWTPKTQLTNPVTPGVSAEERHHHI